MIRPFPAALSAERLESSRAFGWAQRAARQFFRDSRRSNPRARAIVCGIRGMVCPRVGLEEFALLCSMVRASCHFSGDAPAFNPIASDSFAEQAFPERITAVTNAPIKCNPGADCALNHPRACVRRDMKIEILSCVATFSTDQCNR